MTPQQAHTTLVSAGFSYERHQDIIALLSGGERARLQLLAINKAGTNFLVLDEPTNHLDVEGIERLEQELAVFEGTVVLVSHDRRFIENVANRFFLIKDSQLQEVSGIDVYYSYLQDYLLRTSSSQLASLDDVCSTLKVPLLQADLTLLSDDDLYQYYFEIEEALHQKTSGTKDYKRLAKKLEELEQQIDGRLHIHQNLRIDK
ncbi:ATPase components of ABC transporters with duplicated ATPase domains [Nostoc flagelliforme CCNUN1]|uniref:ATPase components of ABC transporters with duplicated ATPase domains n=1 Tax=Nostoc flagelliforme CCNUN1 TaxID=2038116 RepID=A0A2K8T3G3_9NOSO|nr:ATP-binding cassette domain-containing protein [Nostoc flagelliforme]AUB42258.1 ATPase components of ABC transporters with duplicated ATPase domains [Nostoc flagelliforme CCNUN1]